MKKSILFILFLAIIIQNVNSQSYRRNSDKFESNCIEIIDPSEKLIKSWYHYVISMNQNKEYILRMFYPQTNIVTSYETYTDKKLRYQEGAALYHWDNGNKRAEGEYKQSYRHGDWKWYSHDTGSLNSEGNYRQGLKTGEWKDYHSSGYLRTITTYENGLRHGPFVDYDSLNNVMNEGEWRSDTIYSQSITENVTTRNEVQPYIKMCGDIVDPDERNSCTGREIGEYLVKNVVYPSTAMKYDVQGKTYVRYIISSSGEIKDITVMVSFCDQIKQEIIRIIKDLPQHVPGMQNGKAVDVKYTLPINFILQ